MLPMRRRGAFVPEKQQPRRTLHVTPHPPKCQRGPPQKGRWVAMKVL